MTVLCMEQKRYSTFANKQRAKLLCRRHSVFGLAARAARQQLQGVVVKGEGPKLLQIGAEWLAHGSRKPLLAHVTGAQAAHAAADGKTANGDAYQGQFTREPPPGFLGAFQSAGTHPEVVSGAMVIYPPMSGKEGFPHNRATFFAGLSTSQNAASAGGPTRRHQATSIEDLMLIRACNSKSLRGYSNCLGTALGVRVRNGQLTTQPAVIVYMTRKLNRVWLREHEQLPSQLQGPDGLWCDLDVVEFADGAAVVRAECHSTLAEGLRGGDATIGPGSQVATDGLYGTLGAIVQSRKDDRPLGFITNRHVSVDLDHPLQRLYHPLPPCLGPNLYLGTVERAVSYATDHLWYGMFAGPNPDSYVRADGAFVRFSKDLDQRILDPSLKGIGRLGPVVEVDLQKPVTEIVGKRVIKVGRTTGLTTGTIMAFAVEYDDDKGLTFFTDFLILGEDSKPFDGEGDSGSLVAMLGANSSLPRPVGLVWGGTVGHGRLKLRTGQGPENWTSGIGLARLMDLLEVDLVTSRARVAAALGEQEKAELDMPGWDGQRQGDGSPPVRPRGGGPSVSSATSGLPTDGRSLEEGQQQEEQSMRLGKRELPIVGREQQDSKRRRGSF